ncbi:MAG: hypothetical protein IKE22_08825 [Atopobiaceae bacterium]|nr:hypothetical protein [Atopobiaceae bacterium]
MNKRVVKTLAAALSFLLLLTACSFGRGQQVDDGEDVVEAIETVEVRDPTVEAQEPTVEPREVTVNATEENVRLIGRTCMIDDVTWLPQSGSAVEFAVKGTSVTLELAGDDAVENERDLCPRFAVLVDGEVVLDDTLTEPSRTIEVFSGESTTSAVVEVMHLSEANMGAVGVKTITVESDAVTPVVPTAEKELSIEFIGDSITCGYGVEASSIDEPFKTTAQNFMKSYAYLTAKALNANCSAVCYSGYGVISGWSSDGARSVDMLVPSLYDVVATGYDVPWDFTTHASDVVVINLGTNDFTYTGTDEERMREFADGYVDFLLQVRERNPESYLICTMGTMGCWELYPYVEQAVETFKGNTGDTRVTCYPSDPIDVMGDGIGGYGHPNAITQQKSADKLVEVIRESL